MVDPFGRVPFTSALSVHPDAAEATGEVAGRLLETLGTEPDLAVLFVSPHHLDAIAEIAGAVRTLLSPRVLIGATGVAVLAGEQEIEDGPAIALWAGRLAAPPRPVRVTAARTPSGVAVGGLGADTCGPGEVLVLLADPFSLPVDEVVGMLGQLDPPVQVVGGSASAARGPGGNRLVLDGDVVADGGVGVVLPAEVATALVVSQGCRPVGEPMIVTAAERNRLVELAGRPALDRLEQVARDADADDRARMAQGLHVGIAVDEHHDTFGRGDFLVRNLVGADRATRALATTEHVPVGTTVQFQVRDADVGRRGPPCPARRRLDRRVGRRRPGVHLQRRGAGTVRRPRSRRCRGRRGGAVRGRGGAVLRRGDRPGRRAELRARVHGQRPALQGCVNRPRTGAVAASGPSARPTRVARACPSIVTSSSAPST